MLIIPVFDIKDGVIVHAHCGQRQEYTAIKSKLTNSKDWSKIIDSILSLSTFKTIYLADLNAIMGDGNNHSLINQIRNRYPGLNLWIDAGKASPQYLDQNNINAVFGSESRFDIQHLQSILRQNPNSILSLDFMKKNFIGNPRLLKSQEIWPKRIILMQMDQVGSQLGPDWSLLERFSNENKELYLAGGFRDQTDLERLNAHNAQGCLIASALHSKHITSENLKQFSS